MQGDFEEQHHLQKSRGNWFVAKVQDQEKPKADARSTVFRLRREELGKQAV